MSIIYSYFSYYLCICGKKNLKGGQVVILSDVDNANGFGNSYTFETTGECICDKSGLYLLADYFSTNAVNASLNTYKNNIFFGAAYGSNVQYYETLNFVSILQLNVKDILHVTFGGGLIYGKTRISGVYYTNKINPGWFYNCLF